MQLAKEEHVSRRHLEIREGGETGFLVVRVSRTNQAWLNGVELDQDKPRPIGKGGQVTLPTDDGIVLHLAAPKVDLRWLGCLLAALAVVGIALFAHRRFVHPSVDQLRSRAMELARQERFEAAIDELKKARWSWGFHLARRDVETLSNQVKTWQDTAHLWRQAGGLLQGCRWADAHRCLAQLRRRSRKAWAWKPASTSYRRDCLRAASLLDSFLSAQEHLDEPRRALDLLKRHPQAADATQPADLPFLSGLKDELRALRSSVEDRVALWRRFERSMREVIDGSRMPDLDRVREAILVGQQLCRLSTPEHIANANRAARIVKTLRALAASYERHLRAIELAQALRFDQALRLDPKLPSQTTCSSHECLASFRKSIETGDRALKRDTLHFSLLFASAQKARRQEGALFEAGKCWRDPAILTEILDVHCVRRPLPRRSQSAGTYDAYLDVSSFHRFVSSPDGEYAPSQEAVLGRCVAMLSTLDELIRFYEGPSQAWLRKGLLRRQMAEVYRVLSARDDVVRAMARIASSESEPDRRRAIAAGIALALGGLDTTDRARHRRSLSQYMESNRVLLAKLDEDYRRSASDPERRMAIVDQILQEGFPGSTIFTTMWARKAY